MCSLQNGIWLLITTVIVTEPVVSDSQICPPWAYYDERTNRCDGCFDLCSNARIQGTEDECKNLCPEYALSTDVPTTTIPNCPQGQYYDPVIARCDYCSVLCKNDIIQGTGHECKHRCPEYIGDNKRSDNEHSSLSIGGIAGIAVAVSVSLLIIISVYGMTLLCCEHRLPLCLRPRIDLCMPCCFKGYKKPIECTESSTPSSGSTRSSLDAQQESSVVLMTEEGFTDIQSDGHRYRDENDT